MDQERPRSDLSINSRNDLRKVLHLEFLYKENKVCALEGTACTSGAKLGEARPLTGLATVDNSLGKS